MDKKCVKRKLNGKLGARSNTSDFIQAKIKIKLVILLSSFLFRALNTKRLHQ